MARIRILLPCAPDAPRGNATTARRLAGHLRAAGHRVEVLAAGDSRAARPGPALWIALHAVHSAPRAPVPRVVLFTGTDLLAPPPPAARVAAAGAAAVVALGAAAARRARRLYPEAAGRLVVIPQAVAPLPRPRARDLPAWARDLGAETVVLPAGIRAVKDPCRAIRALARLARERPGLRLLLVGPELDAATGRRLRTRLRRAPWIRWPGAVDRRTLAALLARSRCAVSTSRAEGGPPNALLEAAAAGVPVLATDIAAHREFPGPGFLFRSDAGLRRRLARLLDRPAAVTAAVGELQARLARRFRPEEEARAWQHLVDRLLAADQAVPGARPIRARQRARKASSS